MGFHSRAAIKLQQTLATISPDEAKMIQSINTTKKVLAQVFEHQLLLCKVHYCSDSSVPHLLVEGNYIPLTTVQQHIKDGFEFKYTREIIKIQIYQAAKNLWKEARHNSSVFKIQINPEIYEYLIGKFALNHATEMKKFHKDLTEEQILQALGLGNIIFEIDKSITVKDGYKTSFQKNKSQKSGTKA